MYANAGPPVYLRLQRMTVTGTEVTRIQDAGNSFTHHNWLVSVCLLSAQLSHISI